jgi:hypothetical protein
MSLELHNRLAPAPHEASDAAWKAFEYSPRENSAARAFRRLQRAIRALQEEMNLDLGLLLEEKGRSGLSAAIRADRIYLRSDDRGVYSPMAGGDVYVNTSSDEGWKEPEKLNSCLTF